MDKSLGATFLAGLKRLGDQPLSIVDPKGWGRYFNSTTYGGRTIDDFSSMQVSTVWACVKVLSETIGALPWHIYEYDANGRPKKAEHPLSDVLMYSPNSDMTSQEFREAMMTNLALRGNAYAEIDRDSRGNVVTLDPIVSTRVTPMRTPRGAVEYRVSGEHGQPQRDLPSERVWHIKGFGLNGLVGLSPIEYAAQSIGLSLTMEEFGAKFFQNGARVSGVLKLKDWLTDDQRTKAKSKVAEMHTGLENAHKLLLLEGGMDYSQLSVPPEDAQFLESRGYQIPEICRIFGVPPHKVADLSRATFSNIESQKLEFVEGLLPYLQRFEQSAAKRLFSPGDRKRYFTKLNIEGLLRADSAARAALHAVMLQNGVTNRNEVRDREDLPYSDAPGMNDFTVQSNMIPIDRLGEATSSANLGERNAPVKPAN